MPKRAQQSSPARWYRALSVPLTAAAASLLPAPCSAADDPFIHGSVSLGVGIFFGYQLASKPERSGFEWGIEGYATQRYGGLNDCGNNNRYGVGPIVQIGIKGVEDPRLTLALRAGGEIARSLVAFTGELGVSYRFGHDPGPSIHLGAMPELLFLTGGVRHQLLRNETWVGGGVRYLPSFGEQGFCSDGRPLRLGDAKCVAAPPPLSAAGHDARLAAALYTADAQMECVSISAFVQLACDLISAGAPGTLVQRALLAAADELRHTAQCAALAERLGGTVFPYTLPEVLPRACTSRQALLERLAVESYEDGCVGEAIAASQLAQRARLAADSGIAATLRAIARDEASHTQLAWDVLSFCVAEGGRGVRTALAACSARVRRLPWTEEAAPDLQRFGRMQPRALAQLARSQVDRAHARVSSLAA